MTDRKSCDGCMYNSEALCHLNPPVLFAGSYGPEWVYPQVNTFGHYWCGQKRLIILSVNTVEKEAKDEK